MFREIKGGRGRKKVNISTKKIKKDKNLESSIRLIHAIHKNKICFIYKLKDYTLRSPGFCPDLPLEFPQEPVASLAY